jgi:hypothetical protein
MSAFPALGCRLANCSLAREIFQISSNTAPRKTPRIKAPTPTARRSTRSPASRTVTISRERSTVSSICRRRLACSASTRVTGRCRPLRSRRSPGSTDIHIFNPTTNVDTLVYTSPGLIDDIETSLTGLIALAGQTLNNIILLNSSGSVIQQFNTTNFPDGLAFNTTASPPALYSNDNHGTITRYDFGGGYTAAPTNTTIIASGGSYGDIACTGPCKFYATQFFNNGFHGSASFGTHWDNGVTNNDPSIIEIGSKQGCLFDPPVGFNVPEPTAAAMLVLGVAALACRRSRGYKSQGA